MTSSNRVAKHRKRQERAGRRLVTVYLPPQSIKTLRELSAPITQGEVIEQALAVFAQSGGSRHVES